MGESGGRAATWGSSARSTAFASWSRGQSAGLGRRRQTAGGPEGREAQVDEARRGKRGCAPRAVGRRRRQPAGGRREAGERVGGGRGGHPRERETRRPETARCRLPDCLARWCPGGFDGGRLSGTRLRARLGGGGEAVSGGSKSKILRAIHFSLCPLSRRRREFGGPCVANRYLFSFAESLLTRRMLTVSRYLSC